MDLEDKKKLMVLEMICFVSFQEVSLVLKTVLILFHFKNFKKKNSFQMSWLVL